MEVNEANENVPAQVEVPLGTGEPRMKFESG
jgi:hypothetical protein